MGQIADWLTDYEQAQSVYAQIMELLATAPADKTDPASPLHPDEPNLLELLAEWRALTEKMDTQALGPQAIEIRDQIEDLLRMNNEIGEGAAKVRDLIAEELSRRKQTGKKLNAYKKVSSQR